MAYLDIKISIICAVYNGAKHLELCIDKIISQSYTNYELIIIDGGSTDETLKIIDANNEFVKKWISEKDNGIYDAWNKGLSYVESDWVMFIGSDDYLFENNVFAELVKYINDHPGVEYVSSKMLTDKGVFGEEFAWNKFKKSMNVVHPTSLHNMTLFANYGLFDDTYKIAGDYEFLLRTNGALNAGFMNRINVVMGSGGVSNTSIKVLLEGRRARIKNKIYKKSVTNLLCSYQCMKYVLKKLITMTLKYRYNKMPFVI